MSKKSKFCTLRYNARAALFISCAEYCFCDIVYGLQNNPEARISGFADAKLDYYSAMIGVSKRGVEKIRDRMIEKGLITKREGVNNYLQITQKWYDAAIDGYVKKIEVTPTKKKRSTNKVRSYEKSTTNKVPVNHEQSSVNHEQSSKHTYNTIITDKDIDSRGKKTNTEKIIDFKTPTLIENKLEGLPEPIRKLEKKKEEWISWLNSKGGNGTKEYLLSQALFKDGLHGSLKDEISKFIGHHQNDQTLMRSKVFDNAPKIISWLRKAKQYNKESQQRNSKYNQNKHKSEAPIKKLKIQDPTRKII